MAGFAIRVGGKFELEKRIGYGSFGDIYLGRNIMTHEPVALKLEELESEHPQLKHEVRILKSLESDDGPDITGIPRVLWSGVEGDFFVMVMDLLGPSLEDCFNYCRRRFSVKTVLSLADQMLRRVEYCHSRGVLHRDIKPDNFLMGVGEHANTLYLIDFGLAKRYLDSNGDHRGKRSGKSLTGTARYASVNAHAGAESSRRDDLESLGYTLVYLLRGSLPWQGIKADKRADKHRQIGDKKMETTLEALCEGLPDEIREYLQYCRDLGYDEAPDYGRLRRLFRGAFERLRYADDGEFDWTVSGSSQPVAAAAAGDAPGGEQPRGRRGRPLREGWRA